MVIRAIGCIGAGVGVGRVMAQRNPRSAHATGSQQGTTSVPSGSDRVRRVVATAGAVSIDAYSVMLLNAMRFAYQEGKMPNVKNVAQRHGISAFFRGGVLMLAGREAQFGAVLSSKAYMTPFLEEKALDHSNAYILAGVVGAIAAAPLAWVMEGVAVSAMKEAASPKSQPGQLTNPYTFLRKMPPGFLATTARETIYFIGYSVFPPYVKSAIHAVPGTDRLSSGQEYVAMQFGSAGVTTLLSQPVDTVKSAIQRHRETRLSFLKASKMVINETGWLGLYRGGGLRFSKITITFLAVPALMEYFDGKMQLAPSKDRN